MFYFFSVLHEGSPPRRLAEKLYKICARLGISQTQMLGLIGLTDYHYAFVSMWERGLHEPPLIALLRYVRSVGASTDTLIDDDLNQAFYDETTKRPAKEKMPRVRRRRRAMGTTGMARLRS